MVVRRKERVAGIWVNGAGETFPSVPGFYAVLASRPFRAITTEETLKTLGIGFANLDFARGGKDDRQGGGLPLGRDPPEAAARTCSRSMTTG